MNNNWIDYYELLGVKVDASIEEIKKKYRELMKEYHPDIHSKSSIEEQNIYEEKSKTLNEAYDILSSPEKRKEYDDNYNKNKNYSSDVDENDDFNDFKDPDNYYDPTYEEVKENYTKEEQYYAKSEALKQIIEEELEKTNIIIDEKNRLLMDAFYKLIDADSYYESVKCLLTVSSEYIESLNELIDEAKNYGLYGLVQSILDTISFLRELLNDIPENIYEAEFCTKEDLYKESVSKKLDIVKDSVRESIDKIDSILLYTYKGMITKKEYYNIYTNCINEANNTYSNIKEIMRISSLLELEEEFKKAVKLSSELNYKINYIPSNYDEALKLGKYVNRNNIIIEAIDKKEDIYIKIKKIKKILSKHKSSRRYKELYEYQESLYQKAINLLEDAKEEFENEFDIKKEEFDFINHIKKAISIYENSKKINKEVDEVYNEALKNGIKNNEDIIPTITKGSFTLIDKIAALECFVDAKEILELFEKIKKEKNSDRESKMYNELISLISLLETEKNSFLKEYKYVVDVYDNFVNTNSKTYKATQGRYSKGQLMNAIYNEIKITKKKLAFEYIGMVGGILGSIFGTSNFVYSLVGNSSLTNIPISILITVLSTVGTVLLFSINSKTKEYMDSLEIELYNVKQLKNTYNPYNDQVMP